jgi:hypothetical protein
MADAAYPTFWIDRTGPALRYVCITGPQHAVEIAETTDPHNLDPLGFEYRILRTRRTVARLARGAQAVAKDVWFAQAAEMMLTHLGSIQDLATLCGMARTEATRIGRKQPDYSRIVAALQEVKPSRREIVREKIARGSLPLLG